MASLRSKPSRIKTAVPHGKTLGSIVTEVTNATDLDNPLVLQLPRSRVVSAFRNGFRYPDIRITSPTIASPCLILMTTAQAGLTSVNQRPKQALSTEFGNSVSEMLATALFSYSTPANLSATIRTLYNAFPSAGGRGPPRIQSSEPESPRAMA